MQYLMAPTREEVNRAHAENRCLAIGIPGIRNLLAISRRRLILFILLALSSVSLHLVYNSAVFDTVTGRIYSVFVVSESFLDGGTYNASTTDMAWDPERNGWSSGEHGSLTLNETSISKLQKNITQLQHLESVDCITAYGNQLVPDRGNVIAVTNSPLVNMTLWSASNDTFNSSVLGFYQYTLNADGGAVDSLVWICAFLEHYNATQEDCNIARARAGAQNWTIFDQPIQYCLSEQKESFCTLEVSLTIMIIVIFCNAIKAVCMVVTVWDPEAVLATIGDAAASFLEQPDRSTRNFCMASRDTFTVEGKNAWYLWLEEDKAPIAKGCEVKLRFWHCAPNQGRWILTLILSFVALAITTKYLLESLDQLRRTGTSSITDLWTMGFGAINTRSIISFDKWNEKPSDVQPILKTVVITNVPQLFLTTLYFMYNSLYTAMLSEDEWQRYACSYKALRVTSPKGQQRSTYFLSLPYRYSVPISESFAFLHWLCSQSLFLARGIIYDESDNIVLSDSFATCGWSSIAIIFVLVVGSLVMLVTMAMGFRTFRGTMPLSGGHSAVISAACHPPESDADASIRPLQWGALPGAALVCHCTLSSQEVSSPVRGQLYA
ncbi:hypothetical protein MMC27_001429 [Xylographa pallens]|nr:hypothetical protein [Xylographa pallens]